MSADNGVYILETKAPDRDGCEYRVTEAAAIGNLYYDVETGYDSEDFIPEEAFRFFGRCQVFENEEEALLYAHREAQHCYVLEYGVCSLSHPEQVFETFSDEKLKAHEEETEMLIQAHQQERNARQEEKREAAAVIFGQGLVFEPGAVYGYLVQPDGTKVHGSLLGLQRLTVSQEVGGEDGFGAALSGDGLNMEFLPSDWNKDE